MTDYIKIIKPGVLSTVQDAGRTGFRSIGIGPGGAMDQYAFYAANRLLENDPRSPVIEMHFPAPKLEFNANRFCCLTGADFNARLNNTDIPAWKPFMVKPGDILSFQNIKSGFRAYLGVEGVIEADNWLGSGATNLTVHRGGFKGRPLQKEDVIQIENCRKKVNTHKLITREEISSIYDERETIYCMTGPDWNQLDSATQDLILNTEFLLSIHSNRMACLLEKIDLKIELTKTEMLSSAVLMGTVQMLPSGSLAVLMADHQTTGGFPRILQVLQSQLPKLAQTQPGSYIHYKLTDINSAEADFQSFMKKCYYE